MQTHVESFSKQFKLSPRESEIMGLLVNRVTTFKRIAERIGSSPHTVRNQVRSIFSKTHTRNKCDLLGLFLQDLVAPETIALPGELAAVDVRSAEHLSPPPLPAADG